MYTFRMKDTDCLLDLEKSILKKKDGDILLSTKQFRSNDIVYLKLNNLCNITCIYCYQHQEEESQNNYILENYNYIIREVLEKKNTDIAIFGGEPLITENISKLDYIFSMCSSRTKLIIFTNSSYDSFFNEYLTKHKKTIKKLIVTIDGPEEIHNSRRVSKSNDGFKNIINNINYYKEHNISFKIHINVDRKNFKYVEELIRQLEILINLEDIQMLYNRVLHVDETIDDFEFLTSFKKLKESFSNSKIEINYPTVYKLKYYLENHGVLRQRCRSGSNSFVYDFSVGKIYTCPESFNTIIGEFDNKNSITYKDIKRNILLHVNKNNSRCEGCKFVNFCKYGCYIDPMDHSLYCMENTDNEIRYILENYEFFIKS